MNEDTWELTLALLAEWRGRLILLFCEKNDSCLRPNEHEGSCFPRDKEDSP